MADVNKAITCIQLLIERSERQASRELGSKCPVTYSNECLLSDLANGYSLPNVKEAIEEQEQKIVTLQADRVKLFQLCGYHTGQATCRKPYCEFRKECEAVWKTKDKAAWED